MHAHTHFQMKRLYFVLALTGILRYKKVIIRFLVGVAENLDMKTRAFVNFLYDFSFRFFCIFLWISFLLRFARKYSNKTNFFVISTKKYKNETWYVDEEYSVMRHIFFFATPA